MSTILKRWEEIGATKINSDIPAGDLRSYYEQVFGRFYPYGLNIGREVTEKLEKKDFENVWSTLLQGEGLDSGLTSGFLTACGICVLDGLDEDPMSQLPEVMKKVYGVEVEFEIIPDQESLNKYPTYLNLPSEQQWSLPAVMIHYQPIGISTSNSVA